MSDESRVFAALLKYWRARRGLSQFDLALTADVSARHISFLETGRSRPSQEMVLLLAATLDVPLREQNVMLREAGFPPVFEEPTLDALSDVGVAHALAAMLRQHEPFPMLAVDRGYDVLRLNEAARRMITLGVGAVPERWNAMRAFFDPGFLRPLLLDWEATARKAIARLHREALRTPNDERLQALLDEALAAPGVPDAWQTPDLSAGTEGALTLRFRLGDLTLSFVVAMLSFHAPQNVTLDELQIEAYFPSDAATEAACHAYFADDAFSDDAGR